MTDEQRAHIERALSTLVNLQPIIANGLLDRRQLAFIDPHHEIAMEALEAVLIAQQAEQVQEPVAWRWGYRSVTTGEMDWRGYVEIAAHPNLRSPEIIMEPLYTAPPQQAEPVEPVAWSGYDLDGMVEAFSRVIEAHHSSKHPFHNPIDMDAKMALRILRGFIPAMKAYAAPPQRKPLTDEEILEAVGWERAEMYMKLTPNFPVEEARKETIKNARAIERKVRGVRND